jgi:large subunit ribosomal protein L23
MPKKKLELHPTQIIKKPLLTEKSNWEAASRNRYSFEVDIRASKPEIQAAIEWIYPNVRVVRVLTQIRKGHTFRTRWGMSRKPDWKKAIVQLHEDDRIDLI